ncbi:flagellar biosynthesis anti-sigma factor FlgM [Sporolactobacillus sp. THM7-7]|nr:flagellar biosynthesis anti-sigma factor FlgM [Sporolactobacillus sp. THM7-7]
MSDFKINPYQPIRPYTNYPIPKSSKTASTAAGKSDRIEISERARQMQGTEETRQDKLAEIKARIDAGTYHVPAEEVAKKLYAYWNRR